MKAIGKRNTAQRGNAERDAPSVVFRDDEVYRMRRDILFVPFFAFKELEEVMGKDKLGDVFWRSNRGADRSRQSAAEAKRSRLAAGQGDIP